jgi:MoxR-like ATPase
MADREDRAREDWLIFRGDGQPHDAIRVLPEPPPWRRFDPRHGRAETGHAYQVGPAEIDTINIALHLRRPLLITGKAGTGKTSLAEKIAYELGLGPVLKWFITSRSGLADGLYNYDALGYFQAAGASPGQNGDGTDIGGYIRLGPLGTALLPRETPRVLLIDELDKSDIDLPAVLMAIFDAGQFSIPELERLPSGHPPTEVLTADHGERAQVYDGRVTCQSFPIVIITSNGERDLPASFVRRCMHLELKQPGREKLTAIVRAHIGPDGLEKSKDFMDKHAESFDRGDFTTDQFLNAIYLVALGRYPSEEQLSAALLQPPGTAGS